jgi:hypothetical protein
VLEAAFARARVLVQRGESEIARGSRNERLQAAYRHISRVSSYLEPLGKALEPEGDAELVSGLDIRVTGGHSVLYDAVRSATLPKNTRASA